MTPVLAPLLDLNINVKLEKRLKQEGELKRQSIRYSIFNKPDTVLSYDELRKYMLRYSSNTAANHLISIIGHGNIEEGLKRINGVMDEIGHPDIRVNSLYLTGAGYKENKASAESASKLIYDINQGRYLSERATKSFKEDLESESSTLDLKGRLKEKIGDVKGDLKDDLKKDLKDGIKDTKDRLNDLKNEIGANYANLNFGRKPFLFEKGMGIGFYVGEISGTIMFTESPESLYNDSIKNGKLDRERDARFDASKKLIDEIFRLVGKNMFESYNAQYKKAA